MPVSLPIPEGFEIPPDTADGDVIDALVQLRYDNGQLYPMSLDGVPWPEEPAEEEAAVDDMAMLEDAPTMGDLLG